MHILFVCTGNQCRSVMGEYLMRATLAGLGASGITVSSAGTLRYPPHPADPMVVRLLQDNGIDASAHRSTVMDAALSRNADLILCFERAHIDAILGQNPLANRRTFLFDDFVNICATLPTSQGIAGSDPQERLDSILDNASLVRPFLPKAKETTDPHRQSEQVFRDVYGKIDRGVGVIAAAIAH